MKAAVYHGRRDVRIESVAEPLAPGPHEVRLEILRAAICGTDAGEYAHGPQSIPILRPHPGNGYQGPVILGHEMVGRVESVGSGVADLRVGDRVVPGAGMWCGACDWCRAGRTNLCECYYTFGLQANGGLAEYVTVPAKMCRLVPRSITDDAAAIAQPLAVALHAVVRCKPRPGEVAVLIGAGGIGFFVLSALARYELGALVVVDVDDERLRGARAAGATHVIRGGREDPDAAVRELTGGHGAHVVFEASGAAVAPGLATRLVRRGGRVVLIGLQADARSLDLADLVLREIDLVTTVAHICDHDLPAALGLLTDPALAGAAIDRVIPLDALVSDGLVPLAEGRVRGKVVVAPA